MKFSIRSLLVLTTLAFVVLIATVWFKHTFIGSSGSGVSARSANRALWRSLRTPTSATDVTYTVDPYGCEAEFAISERDFLEWCERNNWRTEAIVEPTVYFNPVHRHHVGDNGRVIGQGYHFYPPDGEGTFDANGLRANFWVSTFP